MNIVKNMNKVSLFLLGLVVSFGIASCDSCKGKEDDKVAGSEKVKIGETKTFKIKFTQDINDATKAKVDAPSFKEDQKTLKEMGVTTAIARNSTQDLAFTPIETAAVGDTIIKIVSLDGKTLYSEFKVVIEKKA